MAASSSSGAPTTTYWVGNGQNVAQADRLTVGGTPTAGDTVTAKISNKTITYTVVSGDTTATVATNFAALLAAAGLTVPEFSEQTWAVDPVLASSIDVTASTPGTPFTLSAAATGNTTLTWSNLVPNSSRSDAANANNWLRNNVYSLPQTGDDVVVANTTVPILWNLKSLAAIPLNSYRRWQSFTGTVGLPEWNVLGYYEYRPTYLQLASNVPVLPVDLGLGLTGSGPTRERYDVQGYQTALTVLNAGTAADAYAVRFLGTNLANVVSVLNTSVGVAMLPGEVASLTQGTVDGGGLLDLGTGATVTGLLTVTAGTADVFCGVPALLVQQGGSLTVESTGLTYPSLVAKGGASVVWVSNSGITSLLMQTGARFDKSRDVRKMQIAAAEIDGDTCQVLDPNSAIQYTGSVLVHGYVASGPITFQGDRRLQIN